MSSGEAIAANPGFTVLGRPVSQLDEPRTLIVLGAPRGGTSAVAGVLRKLGVFLGDNASAPVYEDLELATRLEREGTDAAQLLIDDYNQRHAVWAFKRPGMAFTIGEHHHLFRNPIYLAVFRDIFTTAKRNQISSHIKNPLTEKMMRVRESYQSILEFLDQQNPCMLACSYEKMLLQPAEYVDFLLDHSGLKASPEQRAAAVSFIEPQPAAYLQHARADRCHGAVDLMKNGQVRGWVRYQSRFVKRSAEVSIQLDGRELARLKAEQPLYPGCSYPGKGEGNSDENCAFHFELPPGCSGQLQICTSHDSWELDGSPMRIEPGSLWQRLTSRLRSR